MLAFPDTQPGTQSSCCHGGRCFNATDRVCCKLPALWGPIHFLRALLCKQNIVPQRCPCPNRLGRQDPGACDGRTWEKHTLKMDEGPQARKCRQYLELEKTRKHSPRSLQKESSLAESLILRPLRLISNFWPPEIYLCCCSSAGTESACNAGDPSLIPGPGRSLGEGTGCPLQYPWASLVAQLVKKLKVKVAQSALTLCDPMNYTVHGILPGQNTGVDSLSLLQGIFLTQGLDPGLRHCRWSLYWLSHKGNPRILEWVAYPFSSGSSWPRNGTRVSCTAGRFLPTELWRKPSTGKESTCNVGDLGSVPANAGDVRDMG